MMNISKILVPTDFSKNSLNALEYAVKIAEKYRAEIILFHVYQSVIINTDLKRNRVTFDIHESTEVAEEKLSKLISNAQKKCNLIKFSYKVVEGSAGNELTSISGKEDVDLIVMGTRGAGDVGSLLFGSFAAETIENTTCPVLTIPENAVFSGFNQVLFATEFHPKDIESIVQLTKLLQPFNSKIEVIHIAENVAEVLEKMMIFEKSVKERTNYSFINFEIKPNPDFLDCLLEEIANIKPDLLVMSTKKRKFLESLYDRSSTKLIAYQTETPLFVFHLNK